MNVFVVLFQSEDEESMICGVYTTRELAQQQIDNESDPDNDSGEYEIAEREVQTTYTRP